MWTGLLAGLGRVGGFFIDLANAAFKWAGIFFAYRLGRRKERQVRAENANKIKDKQLDIAAKPDLHRGDILGRMFGRKRS